MTGARARRTLPGFRFETKAPPLPDSLPRMDIAVFVGFAASGPLQTPVALESEAQFEALFGEDAPLAWDVERGEQVYAYLAPAVRAFFRNGGRRCWVIRVAGREGKAASDLNRARYNYFPIPGLGRAEFKQDGTLARVVPGLARARSEGSWSDSLSVSSALLSRPEQVTQAIEPDGNQYVVYLTRPAADELLPGDLLRLTFKGDQRILFLTVGSVEAATDSSPLSFGRTVRVKASKPVWFEMVSPASPPLSGLPAQAHVFTHEGAMSVESSDDQIAGFDTVYDARLQPDDSQQKAIVELLQCAPAAAPPPGSVIRIDVGGNELWMTVESLDFKVTEATAFVTGQPVRLISSSPSLPTSTPSCERLTFELWVRKANEYSVSLSDLRFAARHARFWGALPTDEALYQELQPGIADLPATVIWRQVGDLFRFPLAGVGETAGGGDEFYFPLAMAVVPETYLGPITLHGSALQRDGLAEFDARLFIDRDLFSAGTEALSGQADFLRYLSPTPRHLTGMHAAFGLEEATIIAIPDAVHRGWLSRAEEKLPEFPEPTAPFRPDWWRFQDCNPPPKQTSALANCDQAVKEEPKQNAVGQPPWGNFLNCSIKYVPAPQLSAPSEPSATGTFTLSWESSPPIESEESKDTDKAEYILEEATIADFNDAETVYSDGLTTFTIYGRKSGDYFYRVRVTIGENLSDWSNGVAVRVAAKSSWATKPEKDYTPATLLAVQRSLLRMCAARGDLFGVLTLPVDYREDKAIEYVSLLKDPAAAGTENVVPLSSGEVNDFSYASVFHPWLIGEGGEGGSGKQTDSLRRTPPCGTVSGVFAARALARGAWIAPANQPMSGIVALVPPISPERRGDLQDARINLVRQEPRGFVVLDCDTLSDEEDFRPINVRRLLILLRRQALRLGATYVFEPNSSAFRRLVERGFTGMLDEMFVRGAFAGSRPATAYRVVADDTLNTSQSVEQGRFIVELRVAPSLPLTFLTIRFVQTGDRSFVTEVR